MKNRYLLSAVFTLSAVFFQPSISYGLSYQEKKDLNALNSMEYTLKRTPVNSNIFDGKQIKPGTHPTQVRLYLDHLQTQLRSAQSSWRNVSAKGRSSSKASQLAQQFDEFKMYVNKLSNAYKGYSDKQPVPDSKRNEPYQVTTSTIQQHAKENLSPDKKKALQNTCRNFRQKIQPQDKPALKTLVKVAQGQDFFVQNTQELNNYRATISRVSPVCNNAEFINIQEACQAMTSSGKAKEGGYCDAVSNGKLLLQKMVQNYAVFLGQQQGSSSDISPDNLRQQNGWVKLEGAVNWSTLTSGGGVSEVIYNRLKPLYNEVGLTNVKDVQAFSSINSNASKLAAVVKELAPSWNVPGSKCSGDACEVAENTIRAWYPRGKILKTHQNQNDWKIKQHEITKQPIERFRSGWTLLEVPNDPLCQLRSWTVYEKYKGGGSYQKSDNAQIGYVRWQNCTS